MGQLIVLPTPAITAAFVTAWIVIGNARNQCDGIEPAPSSSDLGCYGHGENDHVTCYTAYWHNATGNNNCCLKTATEAELLCKRRHAGGSLAAVRDIGVQSWLEKSLDAMILSTGRDNDVLLHDSVAVKFWIGAALTGLYRQQWTWTADYSRPLSFAHWSDEERPQVTSHRCAYIEPTRRHNQRRWFWKSDNCSALHSFICEYQSSADKRGSSPTSYACGKPPVQPISNQRIVGGVETRPHSWPWMVSLQTENGHVCGGSLIADQWVLSAAHCQLALQDATSKRCVLGLHSLSHPESNVSFSVDIVKTVQSPYYSNPGPDSNDIMLIKLAKPVKRAPSALPVCLPQAFQSVAADRLCITTGWGARSWNLGQLGIASDKLRQVSVRIIDSQTCNQPSWYNGLVDDSMICAGYESGYKDSCQGDSGGPLVCQEDDQSWVLYGVTSWGVECGLPLKPGVYARVSPHVSWINSVIRQES